MFDRQSSTLHIQTIQTSEEFRSLQDRWNTLLSESPGDGIFLRWEWLWAWWKAYKEKNYTLSILLVFRGNDLIGIAPFYIVNCLFGNIFPVRRLMLLGTREGSVISEYMDIIYRSGDAEAVMQGVSKFIEQENICDDIYLQKIDTSSKTIPLLRQMANSMKLFYVIQEEVESPYINLTANYEDFLSNLSSSMRHKIRNNRMKLEKYPEVGFRKTSNILELEADFKELVRLHQDRWESRQFPGSFSEKKFTLFHKMVMQDMLKNGYLELRFLSVNGKNIAALYNIKYRNKIYFYQGGTDISFDKSITPGLLLHSYCIEEAISEGLKEYDLLLMGNMDSYKKRWTRDCRHMCDIYMARPKILKLIMSAKDKARVCYHTIKNVLTLNLSLNLC